MRVFGLGAGFVVVLLALASPALAQEAERPPPAPAPVADDDLSAALETGELTEAEYALERARSVFQLARVRREYGDVARPAPREATLILRDLALRLDELSGADRTAAKRLLARPPAGQNGVPLGNGWSSEEASASPLCSVTFTLCIHWVDAHLDQDAPDPADGPPSDGIPDWVATTLETWENVWLQEVVTLGYRAPLSDDSSRPDNGGGPELDVYLENLGSDGVFGYCTSDDPNADEEDVFAGSAYCVVDNDFSEFGGATLEDFTKLLQVTSAHEFHHASQFAYDWEEDPWFMEGTASNIEETVYPLVDDNVNFLDFWSPLTRPASPLDRGGVGDSEYGAWIFWRFLEEKIAGGDPSIVREIWERAEASDPGVSTDDYSLEAVRHELGQRRVAFRDAFAQFGVTNRLGDYADAQDAGYPRPALTKTYRIGVSRPAIGWQVWRIDHLATRYFAFTPGNGVASDGRLRVTVRLPKRARATVIVVDVDGSKVTRRLEENADGYASVGTRFGRGDVKRVELVLSNGSTRIRSCWEDHSPPFSSCFGRPLDDNQVFQLKARLP